MNDMHDLAALLRSLVPLDLRLQWGLDEPDSKIERLTSATNHVLMVRRRAGDALVVRLAPARDGQWADVEKTALGWAAAAGIGPEVLYHEAGGSILVTRAIAGRPLVLDDLQDREFATRMGQMLRRVHRSDLDLPGVELQDLMANLEEAATAALPGLEISERLRTTVSEALQGVRPPVPSHGDAHAGNWIVTIDGLRLIDWEFARRHEPAWDLATVGLDVGWGSAGVDALLSGYGASDDERSRLRPAALVVLVVDALWSLSDGRDHVRGLDRLRAAERMAEQGIERL
ncbi:phosphotransferase [Alsobacter sp. R-9]